MLRYLPWIFDNREAWNNTINDKRYHYDISFKEFMELYSEYRNPSPSRSIFKYKPVIEDTKDASILEQEDIDELFRQFNIT